MKISFQCVSVSDITQTLSGNVLAGRTIKFTETLFRIKFLGIKLVYFPITTLLRSEMIPQMLYTSESCSYKVSLYCHLGVITAMMFTMHRLQMSPPTSLKPHSAPLALSSTCVGFRLSFVWMLQSVSK